MTTYKNEIHMEMGGIGFFNPKATQISASRAVMFGTQFSQSIVMKNNEPHRYMSGIEQEFGKYTFEVAMPADGTILHIIQRYPRSAAEGAIGHNPETLVIYENEETKEIDYFPIKDFQSFHQTFGFPNVFNTENTNKLRTNQQIKKGTTFAQSPRLGYNKLYMPGLMFETAFMSLPASAEDGFIISESAARRMGYNYYETRRVSLGSNQYGLNIFGTSKKYQCMPEIGDRLRDDGLLMVLRDYDVDLSPVEMSIHDTMQPNFYFDKCHYTRAGSGAVGSDGKTVGYAIIKDIKVIKNNNTVRNLPELMSQQLSKYERANFKFQKEILEVEEKLRYEYRRKFGVDGLKISPRFHRLTTVAMAITGYIPKGHDPKKTAQPINLLHRKEPLDEYTVEFTIEYFAIPDKGNKFTDFSGSKGIVCTVLPDKFMPVDAAGNRAEIVTAPEATPNRMNVARLDLHYNAGAQRDITVELRNMTGWTKPVSIEQMEYMDRNQFNVAYDVLMKYYKIVSTVMYDEFTTCPDDEKFEHMHDVLNLGMYIFNPPNSQIDPVQAVLDIEDNFKLVNGPVQYIHHETGELITTVDNVRIAPLYHILLDKMGTEWSSTSSSKVHIHGILTQLTKSEKFSRPYRDKSTRTIDETGGRIKTSYAGPRLIAELMDRSNNPAVTKHIYYKLLTYDKPSDIDVIVDRKLHPYGNSRTIQHMNHVFNIAGFKISYKPEDLK